MSIKINRSAVVSVAWRIARRKALDLGGTARQHFAQAQRESWVEAKASAARVAERCRLQRESMAAGVAQLLAELAAARAATPARMASLLAA